MAGQLWSVNALGGFMYSDELSSLLRIVVQPMIRFRQFCDAKDATNKGLGKGQYFNWDVFSNVATGGGELNEQEAMPETNFTITQGQLEITEYGNSVPFTEKLDDLSKVPVTEIINKVLKLDAVKTLDGAAFNQFNATPLTAVPDGGSGAGDGVIVDDSVATTTQNNKPLGTTHIKGIVDEMKERNIPAYADDDYYCVARPTTFRPFKDELEALHKYVETGTAKIMNGEIGRYEGVRFIEQTHIAAGGAIDAVAAGWTFRTENDAWDQGESDWAFFLGEDTVAEAICIPEEIRGKIPTDFGRSKGVAWYYLGGFGLVHSGFGNSEARVLKWESAS